MPIGYYNYTVILTYFGLISAVYGMTEALDGRFPRAIACLVISGICDMLDGKIARTMDRTEDEKSFGIQIDSLCDLFCFGAFPAFLGYALGLRGFWGTAAMCAYVLAAVIRLGFFNVMEEKRQKKTTDIRKYYQGLPVTSIAIIFPIVYLLRPCFGTDVYRRVLIGVMFGAAVLFISNIKIYKPGNKMMTVIIIAGIAIIALLRYYY